MSPRRSLALAAAMLVAGLAAGAALARPAVKAEKRLVHDVYFTFKERTPETLEKMIAISHKYLSGHEGASGLIVGVRAEDADEPVSVKDWDVALHVVFESKAAKEAYLVHPRHKAFAEEGGSLWSQVRVFDSYATDAP